MIPWVSILTPLYNGVEFLEECAMSVCLQRCESETVRFTWEWWIGVNGHGITGGDVLIAAEEVKRKCSTNIGDCKIYVINLPEVKGKVEALNALVQNSLGEWIAILDCDDTWERNKLLFQRATIDKVRVDVIGARCNYFGELKRPGPEIPIGFVPEESFWKWNPMINSSVLIRRELAHWEDRYGLEDYDLWLRLVKKGAVFFNVPYYLVNHRLHAGSAFNGKGKQDMYGLLLYHAGLV